MMRLLWHSTAPWVPTGYGVQTRLFAPRIAALGHALAIQAIAGLEGGIIADGGLPVFPRHVDPRAQDVLGPNALLFGADAIITLHDVWTLAPELWAERIPWASYAPINTDPLPAETAAKLRRSATLTIAQSRFGERVLTEAGIAPVCYVPHAYDPAVYRPIPRDEARRSLGWDPDGFYAGVVADNRSVGAGVPHVKALYERLAGFAALRRRHSDARLYVHSQVSRAGSDGGLDLHAIAESLGLKPGADVLFPNQHALRVGQGSPLLPAVYSALDVLIATSCAESFCVPIIEAAACGTPSIVGGWSATAELAGAGWTVEAADATPVWTPLGVPWHLPKPEAIAAELGRAYDARGDLARRERSIAFAQGYEVDHVVREHWRPALAELEERVRDSKSGARRPSVSEASP